MSEYSCTLLMFVSPVMDFLIPDELTLQRFGTICQKTASPTSERVTFSKFRQNSYI